MGEELASLFVPVSAVFSPDGAETYVWVIDPEAKKVSRRAVKTGPLANTGIPIQEGIEAGEWIAIAGVHYLEEGQQVEIMEQRGD
jgi:multidrug efflux pump subunit AcrA (membrane-fusion protein)